ncbi:MAG: hypothetical protein WCT02_04435 [Candidatus Paceibacterota bacterium]
MLIPKTTNRGLIKTIVLIVVLLLILAYFGFNLRAIVSSQTFQDNWNFLKDLTVNVWSNYLSGPVGYFWNQIFLPYIWSPIIDNLSKGSQK